MDNRAEIRRLLLRSRKAAAEHIKRIRTADPLTPELLYEELYQYVLVKYLLTDEDKPEGDGFDELTELSLAKSMKISPALVAEFDTAQSCDGATSAMAKKVLLFRSIENGLDIRIPAMESARIKTMQDFSRMLWHTMQEYPEYAGRMNDQ